MSERTHKQVEYFFPRRELMVRKTVTGLVGTDREAAISAIEDITTSAPGGRTR